MKKTIIERLANFSTETHFDDLPTAVVHECKRLVLDSIGCALAATTHTKGHAGIEYGRFVGGTDRSATILGTAHRTSAAGAAFANGELINTLDMDSVLPPGHVSPYVLPGAFAIGEVICSTGKSLLEATALSHEMSHRFGKAMDGLRDHRDGKSTPPKVFGYASTVFGATAAIGKLKGYTSEALANSLGIAACISPVNFQMFWYQHPPASTIKYTVAGAIIQQAMAAAHMAEFGHSGDIHVLDDREWGYPRFIGTTKWEPEPLTCGLGSEWLFPAVTSYKQYAHCRIMHSSFDCLTALMDEHNITPGDIEGIKVYVEGFAEQPAWLNRTIGNLNDAQFSMAHGIALAAHRPPTARAWMDEALVFSPSVMNLMNKVVTEVHPDYVKLLSSNGASRPAHIEVRAKGRTFIGNKQFPKGSPSPDPETYMTDEQLQRKFRDNAQGVLSQANTEGLVDAVMNLENAPDVGEVLRLAGTFSSTEQNAMVKAA